jgi:predicted DNA-binding transcriptional regulator YafY
MNHSEVTPSAEPLDPLEEWFSAEREPVFYSDDDREWSFLEAMWLGERVEFLYQGGSSPGEMRSAVFKRAFRLRGGKQVYLVGDCELRRAKRIFRLDRIELPIY